MKYICCEVQYFLLKGRLEPRFLLLAGGARKPGCCFAKPTGREFLNWNPLEGSPTIWYCGSSNMLMKPI